MLFLEITGVALESAERKAEELGCNSLILSSYIEGEARHVGTVLSALVREVVAADQPIVSPEFYGRWRTP